MLKGKRILLGVSGSIAAYKAAMLTRFFIKAGAEVKVIMTKAATDFITPLTLGTLSKNEVLIGFANEKNGTWNNHVDLGLWADLMVIAPASANTLAKMATGLCDNLLLATYLSAKCKVAFAPAMDLDMWLHPSTQNNIAKLISYGNVLIEPKDGELASGLTGVGRMAEPEEIISFVTNLLKPSITTERTKVLITAGPTYEPIDPVRFVGNRSSGKMGFALAKAFADGGAEVKLITGPSKLNIQHHNVECIRVETADEMYQAVMPFANWYNIAVLSAAVADYTPALVQTQKIKKSGDLLTLSLQKTKDILKELGTRKNKNQVLVGFALETQNEETNAAKKLIEKNADFIILNSLNTKGAGFNTDTNEVTLLGKNNFKKHFPLQDKSLLAQQLVKEVLNAIHE